MDISIVVATFSIIAVTEFGDKTQLAALTLATGNKLVPVFLGCLLGVLLVDGVGVLVGHLLYSYLPMFWIGLGSGLVFILFGIHALLKKDKVEEDQVNKSQRSAFLSSWSLLALMELGDKTQLASIVLSARYMDPLPVFLGIVLAFTLVMGIGVAAGAGIKRVVPRRYLKVGSAILFIAFGALFVVSALTGTQII